jgi:hypothetical protein
MKPDPQSLEAWVIMLSLTLACAIVLAVVLIGCQVPLR